MVRTWIKYYEIYNIMLSNVFVFFKVLRVASDASTSFDPFLRRSDVKRVELPGCSVSANTRQWFSYVCIPRC